MPLAEIVLPGYQGHVTGLKEMAAPLECDLSEILEMTATAPEGSGMQSFGMPTQESPVPSQFPLQGQADREGTGVSDA